MKLLIIWTLFLALLLSGGCGIFHHSAIPAIKPAGVTAHGLTQTSSTLTLLVFIGVVGFSVGAAAYFFLPGDHRLPMSIMALGGTMLVLSLFIQSTLWLLPWLFGTLLLMGGIWLALRLYRQAKIEKLIAETT